MPISATIRLLAAAAVIVPIAAACSPNEPVATEPGTTPPVWTGSPSPSAPAAAGGHGSGAAQGSGETLTADLKTADGTEVATATIEFTDGFATVTVETTTAGELTPGFHGLHIHQVGTCEGDFTSAGGHFQAEGHSGHPSSGDLSSLQVRSDGSAKLVTTTDAFTAEELLAGTKTAIVIHEKADNFGNIPAEKYQQVNGTPGPDQQTLATGDAGGRVACGVISAD
ncbi:superoxide dismutase [Mycobacterium adipatum]|jgi:Cu-Zn family superoxide dismutase|uniref:Superoxide dismutase [Cu-Zn] n=1 Tax=Mycobacterium adipatum TaxID=1682113 RepID=A0A172UTR3_9MYCO|nr:superoxide dismutase family protein [Mycobacterium adipatum]ANE82385.1 superoxide dismutase [Mycobacterium adipatum]MBI5736677.1 superoxide dismutase family protein [Mycolicibacterium neoaurum]